MTEPAAEHLAEWRISIGNAGFEPTDPCYSCCRLLGESVEMRNKRSPPERDDHFTAIVHCTPMEGDHYAK